MSHELRTPLQAILGWVRMLRSGTLDETVASHALETIERNAVRAFERLTQADRSSTRCTAASDSGSRSSRSSRRSW